MFVVVSSVQRLWDLYDYSLLKIGNLCLSGTWRGLWLGLVDTKKTCYDEIGMCAQNISNHPRFNIEHSLGGPK